MVQLTVALIESQEKELVLQELNADVAFKIGLAARELAEKKYAGRDVAIDITTVSGATLFRTYIGNIQPDNEVWLSKKRNSVIRFQRASKRFGLELTAKGRTLQVAGLDEQEYTIYGGGFPIRLASAPGFVLAVITVSGLKDFEDHDVAVSALSAVVKGN